VAQALLLLAFLRLISKISVVGGAQPPSAAGRSSWGLCKEQIAAFNWHFWHFRRFWQSEDAPRLPSRRHNQRLGLCISGAMATGNDTRAPSP